MQKRPDWVDDIDWDDLYPRVLAVAYRMSAGRANRRHEAEQLAQEAITRSFTTRTVDLKRYELFVYLVGIMRSIRSDQMRSPGARLFDFDDEAVIRFPTRPTQDDALSMASLSRLIEQQDPAANQVAMHMLAGLRTSREIAEAMSVSPQKVDALKKNLRRIILALGRNEVRVKRKPPSGTKIADLEE